MAGYEVVCCSAQRPDWLAARRSGIGSSDAPAILGVSPFCSALEVYTDKLGLRELDTEETEAMRWGRILEPHIIAEFARETERDADRAGDLLRSTKRPWMLCTLDGTQERKDRFDIGLVEAKATGWRAADWDEGIPHHVFVQIQHQFVVTGMEWGSAVVLQNGCKLFWVDIERDEPFIQDVLLPAEFEFWQRVQDREPVAPDGSASAAAALQQLYPKPEPGKTIHLPGDLIELDDDLVLFERAADEAVRQVETIRQTIRAAMGDAEVGVLANGVKYTHKLQRRGVSEFRVLRRCAPKETR